MLKTEFKSNWLVTTNPSNTQHNEIKTKLSQAGQTKILHLNNYNLDTILPGVIKLGCTLIRLDMSFNNIVKIEKEIGEMKSLRFLWLNDNPLREIHQDLCKCVNLREIDLRKTYIMELPRELAELQHLMYFNLDKCPLKSSLDKSYGMNIATLTGTFQRKNDRKFYKQKILNKLTEWVYPSIEGNLVLQKLDEVFQSLKDSSTFMLKKLYRNAERIFPKEFPDIDAELIRGKLGTLLDESLAREEIAKIQLKLKAHFQEESLKQVDALARDLHYNSTPQLLEEFLIYKKHVFTLPFIELSAELLNHKLDEYKKRKIDERKKAIQRLFKKIQMLYFDEKLEDEVVNKMGQDILHLLKKTEIIVLFTKCIKQFMPKSHELKYFDAQKIVTSFINSPSYHESQETLDTRSLTSKQEKKAFKI